MDLKPTDKKLLAYLFHSYREPLTKIAKETGLSREQVEYKINKFVKEGVIKKFVTFFNSAKLGYSYNVLLLLKFQKYSSVRPFTADLKETKNCSSWGACSGKYDLYLNLIFKNETELNEYLAKLIGSKQEAIFDYLLIKPYFAELYPLKFLESKERDKFTVINTSTEKIKLDEAETGILKLLAEDGRMRLIDIANKLTISNELASYKLKKLYNEGVILGTRIQFDMNKLGYYYTGLMLHLKHMSDKNIERLKRFAKNNHYIINIGLSVAKPNCLMQVFHKTEEELRTVLEDLKQEFKDESFDIEILLISAEEEEANMLPFL